jgi:serine/threonine-protein kinase
MSSSLSPGTKLGRYEIRSQLGAGGMGEVYLALDTELDRTVAIKILPPALASDPERLQRFVQEAKAASALNHPHILTIHEIGTTGTSRFIATEYIDGDTLRQKIRSASLGLNEVLEIATQVAGALSAAHAAGIIHRDIKPENIMVRSDGYIKLLDFGLAKLATSKSVTTDTEAPTKALVNTDAGTVMGTANYMSPEQAKGTKVDSRTDLWSLGAVVYEMVTGHVPFSGETPTETISLILQREPTPLAHYVQEVPAELERIIDKTLTKDREQRYQSAKDLLIDLRNLKRRLEVNAEIDRTSPPELRPGVSTMSGETATVSGEPHPTAAAVANQSVAGSASSAEYIVSGIKQHKLAAAIVLLMLLSCVVGYSLYRHASNSEVAIESIAVLPFANASGNPDSEYLSDGISESLINSLSQLPGVKVIARSSSFQYKGKEVDLQEVARALGVEAVLTGRVAQRGDQLIVSAELVNARDKTQMWGEQYQRPVADLLAVQREIAKEISGNLRLRLSGEAQQQMNNRSTGNAQAYELYLKGHYYMNRLTEEGVKKGLGYFQQAIDIDPRFAPAYAGVAESYAMLSSDGVIPAKEAIPKAKAAALKALELDEALAEAHTSLAFIAMNDWDWRVAEREFKRAIALNPNYVNARHWYSHYLISVGRIEESLAESKRALELDPLDVAMNFHLGWHYFYARQYDQAIAQLQETLEMDRNSTQAHYILGWAYEQKGRFDDAIAELQKSTELGGGDQRGSIGHVYAISGRRGEAQKLLDQLQEESTHKYVSPYSIAVIYEGLGQKDQAFAWLERAYAERESSIKGLKLDPEFASLHSDPRFTDLLRRIGF